MMWKLKRFYRTAEVAIAPDGYAVTLDGRSVKTPAGSVLTVVSEPLAAAVAEEWLAQEDTIRPDTMPLMRLAATVLDRVGPYRPAMIEQALSYATTDLVCYRAEAPADLIQRQEAGWQPLVEWLGETHGARLEVTSGIIPLVQPATALDTLRGVLAGLSAAELTALVTAMQACGSLVIALALVGGRVDADTAFELSQLDESYQIERWGEDDEAAERRRNLREDIRWAAAFLDLARATKEEAP